MSGEHGGDGGGESSGEDGVVDGAREAVDGVVDRARPSRRTMLTMLASAGVGAAVARHEDVADAIGGATGGGIGAGGDASDLLPGAEGHEHEAALALVPTDEATHVATRSGAWDDAGTWDGGVPTDGARVHVPEDTVVRLRHRDAAELRWVRVDGALVLDPGTDTHLQAETIVTTPGSAFQVGTPENPVGPEREALVTFADFGPIDERVDPERVGTGLLAMGSVDVHGAETTTWSALATAPEAGDRVLELPEAPTNWGAGDRLVVPGMHPSEDQDEAAFVEAVDGTTVELDRELAYDHAPPAEDLDAYVVALDRPVRFRSANDAVPRRGHVMLMAPAATVEYAAFEGLGRTDKSYPFTNPQHGRPPADVPPNPRARYALHFHETGIDADPHRVEGVAVDGSPGWGVVNHHSHAEVVDSVTYDVFGAGFVAEAGNERGVFRRNFALRSQGSGELLDSRSFHSDDDDREPGEVDDFGHGGHGFWLQGPMVALEDNVAAGHRYYAFAFWNRPLVDRELRPGESVDRLRGTVPNTPLSFVDQPELADSDHVTDGAVSSAYVALRSVADNVAFASGGGLEISRHQFGWDHERVADWSVVDGFTAFNVGPFVTHWGKTPEPKFANHRGGNTAVNVRYSNNLHLRNLRLVSGAGRDGVGVGRNNPYPFNLTVDASDVAEFREGLRTAVRGAMRVTGTRLANARNVAVRDEHRWPTRRIALADCTFERGADGHVVTELASLEDLGATELFTPHRSTLVLDGREVYYPEQRPGYVPIPDRDAREALGDDATLNELTGGDAAGVVGKTNRELRAEYGIATKGAVTPADATNDDRVPGKLESAAHADGHEAWLDAQAGDLPAPWEVESSPNAAGGEYVTTRGVDATDGPPSEGHATYEFSVDGGRYYVGGRVQAPDGESDSFWLRVDDGEWTRWDRMRTRRGSWTWTFVPDHDREGAPPKGYELDAGSHTLTVAFREDDAKLDRLVVTPTASPPVLFGEPASE